MSFRLPFLETRLHDGFLHPGFVSVVIGANYRALLSRMAEHRDPLVVFSNRVDAREYWKGCEVIVGSRVVVETGRILRALVGDPPLLLVDGSLSMNELWTLAAHAGHGYALVIGMPDLPPQRFDFSRVCALWFSRLEEAELQRVLLGMDMTTSSALLSPHGDGWKCLIRGQESRLYLLTEGS